MKKVSLILMVLMVATMVLASSNESNLNSLRDKYLTAKTAIDNAEDVIYIGSLKSYAKALDAYANYLKKRGDIDGYTAINDEKVRFQASKTVLSSEDVTNPHIKKATLAYEKIIADSSNRADASHLKLLKRYTPALEILIKQLMQADKMVEAKAVKGELDRVQFIVADIETNMPKIKSKAVEKKAITFKDIKDESIVGKYAYYVNGKKLDGYLILHANHAITNPRGQKKKPYRWSLHSDKLVLKWGSTATVFTEVEKKGVYGGERSGVGILRMVKTPSSMK